MLLLFSIVLCSTVESARILGVYPTPSISHQVVFRTLTLELAKRGHELVVVTPNPALPKGRPKDNIREIDISHSYNDIKAFHDNSNQIEIKRGVIFDIDAMATDYTAEGMVKLMAGLFDNEEVNDLIQDKTQKFDLVIVEGLMHFQYIFAKIFDAPLIAFSSLYGLPELLELAGAVSRHPIIYPHMMRNKFENLTFFETIQEIYNEYKVMNVYSRVDEVENELLRNKFGKDAPTVNELKELVSMVFLNSFPMFANNRPVPPNVVYLGALHLQPVKELPKDLKQYLDNSKRGVVYVSLGTNVQTSKMDKDMLDAFLNAFRRLPYDILWKFDWDNSENIPKNVKIQKWFPQRDLLVHPNLKAFVTQGGMQSTDEAIDAGVPLVGIPMMGDQWTNTHKYVQFGIGVQLHALTLTADDIVKGVETVIADERYRKNMKHLKDIMYDTPQSPLERAVWWTEYVLRHKGAKHLRCPAANMSYTEYYMIDFILYLIAAFALSVAALMYGVCYVIRICKSKKSIKFKSS